MSGSAAFWVSASVVAICLWGSASPSMVFPLYLEQWHLDPEEIETVFAAYPFTVAFLMLILGGLSDRLGRRRTMLIGLSSLAVGSLVFALAPALPFLYVGRLFQAIGTATALSAATAALVEFEPQRRAARVSRVTILATATGLVIASLIAGALIEYAPLPLHLTFWLGFALAIGIAFLVLRLPDHPEARVRKADSASSRPRLPRKAIATGASALIAAYAMGALVLSLGADIARDLLGTDDAFLAGAVIALFSLAIGAGGLTLGHFPVHRLAVLGTVAAVVSLGVLLIASTQRDLLLFSVSSLLAGAAFAAFLSTALGVVVAETPPEAKAVTMSRLYATGYAVQGVLALALGAIADISLPAAITSWIVLLAVIGSVASFLVWRRTRPARPARESISAG
ncbi:MFS transporter [Amnibacterium flavum]|uniref:MFS transporter n=1 Tax=Amnibacterium flavum TaxID=2173173 RepID=UPI001403D0E8|nr:MFS transporter [Amnibacterium flavum]